MSKINFRDKTIGILSNGTSFDDLWLPLPLYPDFKVAVLF